MTTAYESVVRLSGKKAEKVIQLISTKGEAAALDYLKQGFTPGDGTLGSHKWNPWKETDKVYRAGGFVLYYDPEAPSVGVLHEVSV